MDQPVDDYVKDIWELSGEALPESAPCLDDRSLGGVGSTGTGFNTHRWRELVCLIDLIRAFKLLPADQQHRQAEDPWAFAEWLYSEVLSVIESQWLSGS